jgi:hypothetical protein
MRALALQMAELQNYINATAQLNPGNRIAQDDIALITDQVLDEGNLDKIKQLIRYLKTNEKVLSASLSTKIYNAEDRGADDRLVSDCFNPILMWTNRVYLVNAAKAGDTEMVNALLEFPGLFENRALAEAYQVAEPNSAIKQRIAKLYLPTMLYNTLIVPLLYINLRMLSLAAVSLLGAGAFGGTSAMLTTLKLTTLFELCFFLGTLSTYSLAMQQSYLAPQQKGSHAEMAAESVDLSRTLAPLYFLLIVCCIDLEISNNVGAALLLALWLLPLPAAKHFLFKSSHNINSQNAIYTTAEATYDNISSMTNSCMRFFSCESRSAEATIQSEQPLITDGGTLV